MNNIRGLLGLISIDKAENEHIRELYVLNKGENYSILKQFGHLKKMDSSQLVKLLCVGKLLAGRSKKK